MNLTFGCAIDDATLRDVGRTLGDLGGVCVLLPPLDPQQGLQEGFPTSLSISVL